MARKIFVTGDLPVAADINNLQSVVVHSVLDYFADGVSGTPGTWKSMGTIA
jgi:hypothetical protein